MLTNREQVICHTLKPEISVLYRPQSDWTYSHHASLTKFRGRFYAMWSNGWVNEDDVGQRVLAACSADGILWSDPYPLFESFPDGSTLTAAGWFEHDGVLNAYAGRYRYRGVRSLQDQRPKGDCEHEGTTLFCRTSADGQTWSDVTDLHLPVIPNQGPRRLSNGRLLICGNVTAPYTDDKAGLSGWKIAGLNPCPVAGLQDDSEGFWVHQKLRGDEYGICEGSFFEKDGRIQMLFRDAKGKLLISSESTDFGESWSKPVQTDFTDNNSKFYCMRLTDGRYAIVSNPEQKGPRCPLAISLSGDGEHFTVRNLIATEPIPRRYEGMYKGGIYGYPHAIEADGILYVICSVNKEDIYLFRIPVKDL